MERVECKDLALRAEQEDLRGYKETPLETVSPRCGLLGSPESLYLVAMRDGAGEYRGVEGRPVAERSSQMQDGRQLSCGASVAATPGAASPAAGPAPTLPSLRRLAPSDPVTFSPSTFPKKNHPLLWAFGQARVHGCPFSVLWAPFIQARYPPHTPSDLACACGLPHTRRLLDIGGLAQLDH